MGGFHRNQSCHHTTRDAEGAGGGGSGASLTDALQALVCTLPPRGFAPRRLWPVIVQVRHCFVLCCDGWHHLY